MGTQWYCRYSGVQWGTKGYSGVPEGDMENLWLLGLQGGTWEYMFIAKILFGLATFSAESFHFLKGLHRHV